MLNSGMGIFFVSNANIMPYNLSVKIFVPEKDKQSNIKHKMLVCFYTSCANIKRFERKLAKLLVCKVISIFFETPCILCLNSFKTNQKPV